MQLKKSCSALLAGFLVFLFSGQTFGQLATTPQQIEFRALNSNMHLMNGPAISLNVDEKTETHIIDLGPTITGLAESKSLSVEEARIETLTFCGMQPKTRLYQAANDNPTFKHISEDRYSITARKQFFEVLPSMQRCLELGMKQTVISCHIVTIEPSESKRINAFFTPGTVEVNCAKIPDVKPVATAMNEADETSDFVSTSTTITMNTPVTTGLITGENFEKLLKYLRASNADISMAPKLVLFPGQIGTISDAAQRPFVVGLEAIHGPDERVAMQPVIQALEDGVTVRVKATPNKGKLQLLGDIAISQVTDVGSFTFTSSGARTQQSFQIPHHSLRQIHLSSTLDADTAIVIDPNFVQSSESANSHNRQTSLKHKTIFVLRAELIDMRTTPLSAAR